jgi:hypothetical protein
LSSLACANLTSSSTADNSAKNLVKISLAFIFQLI